MSEEIKFEKRVFKQIIPTHFDECIKSERKLRQITRDRQNNNSGVIGKGGNHIEQTKAAFRKLNQMDD